MKLAIVLLRGVMLTALLAQVPQFAMGQSKPVLVLDQECAAPAFAPDGRLAYAVRRTIKVQKFEMQRDDIWMLAPGGKPKRIMDGEELIYRRWLFGYAIQTMRWSPDGALLAVEMRTIRVVDEDGNTLEGYLTVLFDKTGKVISERERNTDSVIVEGSNSAWLGDGVTVAYFLEAVKPNLLFHVGAARPVAARILRPFEDRTFAAIAWDPPRSAAIAVQRDPGIRAESQFVWLDVLKQTRRELVIVDNFAGGLTVSPSGKRFAYFRGADILEIREVENPERVGRIRVTAGTYAWTADERRILMKRGELRKNGNLVWLDIPPLEAPRGDAKSPDPVQIPFEPILGGLTFREFALSPDGRWLAVTSPGARHLSLYSLP